MQAIQTRRGASLVRKVKGVGLAIAVLVGSVIAVHVIGAIFSVLGLILSLAVPGLLVYVLYKLFFKE